MHSAWVAGLKVRTKFERSFLRPLTNLLALVALAQNNSRKKRDNMLNPGRTYQMSSSLALSLGTPNAWHP